MTVYYTENSRAYHYSQACDHLKYIDADRIKTADEADLDRHICYDCQQHQEVLNSLATETSF